MKTISQAERAKAERAKKQGRVRLSYSQVFDLSDEQKVKLEAWRKKQERKAARVQIARGSDMASPGKPYYGTIGGGYTFSFTPTGLGTCIKVTNDITKEEIDLTDVSLW